MPALPNPALLTANGDYDISVTPGLAYLITIKGTFNGATATLKTLNSASGNYDNVIDGAFTAATEQNFRAPSNQLRISITNAGGSTSISIEVIPHKEL
jgi:hypothetical protein